jgi:DNA-binding protein H-NS
MPRQKNFSSMTLEQLLDLRNTLDEYLGEKREQLQNSLAALEHMSGLHQGKPGRQIRAPHPSKGKKVRPKYRNPEEPSQTWAGRGAQPRWLRAQLVAGKRLEDFAVGKASGSGSKSRKRGR